MVGVIVLVLGLAAALVMDAYNIRAEAQQRRAQQVPAFVQHSHVRVIRSEPDDRLT